MSAVASKRSLENLVPVVGVETQTQKKKAGRKLLKDDDAKSKRTVQNRTAQRAFRERKEKRLKELEDKVKVLEEAHVQSEVETVYLRSQLKNMVDELRKFRPENSSDIKVLEYLARNETKGQANTIFSGESDEKIQEEIKDNVERKKDFTFEFPSNNKLPSPDSTSSSQITLDKYNVQLGKQDQGSVRRKGSSVSNRGDKNQITTPNSTVSSNTWIDPVFYSDDAQKLPQFQKSSKSDAIAGRSPSDSVTFDKNSTTSQSENSFAFDGIPFGYDSNLFSNDFDFNGQFDDQVSNFIDKVNDINYTPAVKETLPFANGAYNIDDLNNNIGSTSSNTAFGKQGFDFPSTISSDTTNWSDFIEAKNDSQKYSNSDAISSVFGNNELFPPRISNEELQLPPKDISKSGPFIDCSLAFPESTPSFEMMNHQDFRDSNADYNNTLMNLMGDENDDSDEEEKLFTNNLVTEECTKELPTPVKVCKYANAKVKIEDGSYVNCSQVWNRLTQHPKYSELDIDGLCQELMLQAKCSDTGVVVESKDLQKALTKYLSS